MSQKNQRIFTVSQLNAEVRLLLESEMGIVWLLGELSNFVQPVSGHWYFTLKDSRAQVKCAMFRGNNRTVSFKPANGHQVLIRARLSLYEPRGDYQLIAESMQPEGDGLLQQAFEQLKQRLAAEGLFSTALKKPLPETPKCIGIITSKTGAALQDILQILKRRDPCLPIIIYPTQVQGNDAAADITDTIKRANIRNECDVLILGRGGGSLEDLWCFNEEKVARAIAASEIPIISAVGHEIDTTISDFVADIRAPTPSAAAEIVSQDIKGRQQKITQRTTQLHHLIIQIRQAKRQCFSQMTHLLHLQHPRSKIHGQAQQLDDIENKLQRAIMKRIQSERNHLHKHQQNLMGVSPEKQIHRAASQLSLLNQKIRTLFLQQKQQNKHNLYAAIAKLDALSPLSTLTRGYSITKDPKNTVIRSIEQVQEGDDLITHLKDGILVSNVQRKQKMP